MKTLLFIIVASFLLFPHAIFAQQNGTDYRLLQSIPIQESGCTGQELINPNDPNSGCVTNASRYIQGVFTLIIALAGVLAVVMIIIGGVKYLSSEAFTDKSDAKSTITNAIIGLLLAISSWLILYTINPKLVEFDLTIDRQPIATTTTNAGLGRQAPTADCPNCVVLRVRHKPPPMGCHPPAGVTTCSVDGALQSRLLTLSTLNSNMLVTESYPPTRTHQNSCHANGTCVDATIGTNPSPQNIANFITNARTAGLNAQFETTSEARAQAIRAATGLPATQVYYVPGITGEHFSVYGN